MKKTIDIPAQFDEIGIEELIWIMDHVFGNIFACDEKGNIIFLNQKAADVFGLSRQEILSMNTRDIVGNKIINRSTTLEALEKKETVVGNFKSRNNIEYFAISTPLLDKSGNVKLIMTYSQEKFLMTTFIDLIEKERKIANKYKNVYAHITNQNAVDVNNGIVLQSEKIKQTYQYAEKIARSDSTVLILGETGTGKDVLSNFIHNKSLRSSEPIIPVNCSAIPSHLVESEFFGYKKGAFTGANKEGKPGIFDLADGGTLFLDEIAELPIPIQAKLLRVIETGEFMPIGGTKMIKTNIRLITATNKNLQNLVERNLFRKDLYYRINIIPVEVPPLRERVEDIIPLANHFLSKLNQKYSTNKEFTPATIESLKNYKWPGNVRELNNMIERLYITSKGNLLKNHTTLTDFSTDVSVANTKNRTENIENSSLSFSNNFNETESLTIEEHFKKTEKQKIINALLETKGNKKEAAKLLGISTGKLYRKLKQKV